MSAVGLGVLICGLLTRDLLHGATQAVPMIPPAATSFSERSFVPHGRRHQKICEALDPIMPIELQKEICGYDCDITLLNSERGGKFWRGPFLQKNATGSMPLSSSATPMLDVRGDVNVWREVGNMCILDRCILGHKFTWPTKNQVVDKLVSCAVDTESEHTRLFLKMQRGWEKYGTCIFNKDRQCFEWALVDGDGRTRPIFGLSAEEFTKWSEKNAIDRTLVRYHGSICSTAQVPGTLFRQFDTKHVHLRPSTEHVVISTVYMAYLFKRERLKKFTSDEMAAIHVAALEK